MYDYQTKNKPGGRCLRYGSFCAGTSASTGMGRAVGASAGMCAGLGGYTLIEALAAMMILVIFLSGIFVAYNRSTDMVTRQMMRDKAVSVAQEKMETLIASRQEPGNNQVSGTTEDEPLISWNISLQRETIAKPVPTAPLAATVIKATITAYCNNAQKDTTVKLVRYFNFLKPIAGHAVAVPLSREEPSWYSELKSRLGREPTLQEILEQMSKNGQLPADVSGTEKPAGLKR